jgi:hypothetical protein
MRQGDQELNAVAVRHHSHRGRQRVQARQLERITGTWPDQADCTVFCRDIGDVDVVVGECALVAPCPELVAADDRALRSQPHRPRCAPARNAEPRERRVDSVALAAELQGRAPKPVCQADGVEADCGFRGHRTKVGGDQLAVANADAGAITSQQRG